MLKKSIIDIMAGVFYGLILILASKSDFGSNPALLRTFPKGLFQADLRKVPSDSVKFLWDITYLDKDGKRRSEQMIFNEIIKMIENAKEYILIDMFLYNDFKAKDIGVRDSNQNQFSGANSCKLQGARSDAMPQRIVSDEQRRSLQEFTRPKGSQKMDDFCVAPPQCSVKLLFRRRALKSSHFLASKADFGSNPALLSEGRKLSDELTRALIAKKKSNPDIIINLITDPINTIYGGQESSYFSLLKENGIKVIITDLKKIRDSNFLYSPIWRVFFQWFKNSDKGAVFPNPFVYKGKKIPIRSYLELLNFKANHRKLVMADCQSSEGVKLSVLITSSNIHDISSEHSNAAIRIDDYVWQDLIKSEQAIARFSGLDLPRLNREISDRTGEIEIQLLTESAIGDKLVEIIDAAGKDDEIDMMTFYLSDEKTIKAFLSASERGAAIRLILDPNKDAFGYKKNGIPNRPAARRLNKKSGGKIKIRWYETHGEQCHSKFISIKNKNSFSMILGSANFTRRNIRGYNLEADVYVRSFSKIDFFDESSNYFNRAWNNEGGGLYTVDYENYKEDSFLKYILYRLMEITGFCTF